MCRAALKSTRHGDKRLTRIDRVRRSRCAVYWLSRRRENPAAAAQYTHARDREDRPCIGFTPNPVRAHVIADDIIIYNMIALRFSGRTRVASFRRQILVRA